MKVVGTDKPRVLSASTLIGDSVHNTAGENLGKVEELMLELEQGTISYAVLSFGGFLGMGNKLFAVPWNAFSLDTDKKAFVLNVPKEKLEKAPGFDKANWPDFADRKWGQTIHEYYGTRPYWS